MASQPNEQHCPIPVPILTLNHRTLRRTELRSGGRRTYGHLPNSSTTLRRVLTFTTRKNGIVSPVSFPNLLIPVEKEESNESVMFVLTPYPKFPPSIKKRHSMISQWRVPIPMQQESMVPLSSTTPPRSVR